MALSSWRLVVGRVDGYPLPITLAFEALRHTLATVLQRCLILPLMFHHTTSTCPYYPTIRQLVNYLSHCQSHI